MPLLALSILCAEMSSCVACACYVGVLLVVAVVLAVINHGSMDIMVVVAVYALVVVEVVGICWDCPRLQ